MFFYRLYFLLCVSARAGMTVYWDDVTSLVLVRSKSRQYIGQGGGQRNIGMVKEA